MHPMHCPVRLPTMSWTTGRALENGQLGPNWAQRVECAITGRSHPPSQSLNRGSGAHDTTSPPIWRSRGSRVQISPARPNSPLHRPSRTCIQPAFFARCARSAARPVVEEEIVELGRSRRGDRTRCPRAAAGPASAEPGTIGVSRSCWLPGAGHELVGARCRLPGGGLVTDAPPSTAERRRVTVAERARAGSDGSKDGRTHLATPRHSPPSPTSSRMRSVSTSPTQRSWWPIA